MSPGIPPGYSTTSAFSPKPSGLRCITPEFVSQLGPTLQSLFPFRLRVVDPSTAIAAQLDWESDRSEPRSARLGGPVDELHDELHQLIGRPSGGL